MNIIKNHSDFSVPVIIYTSDGFPVAVSDVSALDISIYTTDPNVALSYDKSDVSAGSISVSGADASALANGVLYYKYAATVEATGSEIAGLCQTDIYLMNTEQEFKSTCATAVSELINDAGYVTTAQMNPIIDAEVEEKADSAIEKKLDQYAKKTDVDASIEEVKTEVAESISEVEAKIPTVPTKVSAFINDAGYLTEHQSLDNYASKQYVFDASITKQDTLVSGTNIKTLNGVSILGEGDLDVTGGLDPIILQPYAKKTWVQEQGYLTEHQSLTNYTTKTYVATNYINVTDYTLDKNNIESSIYSLKTSKVNYSDLDAYVTTATLATYASKQYVSDAVSVKQNILTAGTGISIDNDVIKVTLDTNIFIIVDSLPEVGVANKIYLVPSEETSVGNIYTEYMYVNDAWEQVGTYKSEIDLTPYLKKADAEATYQKMADMPTKVSYFTNDAGYLTQHQSLEDYMPKAGGTFTGGVMMGGTNTFSLNVPGNYLYGDSTGLNINGIEDLRLHTGGADHRPIWAYGYGEELDSYEIAIVPDIPTKTSQLTNDSDFATKSSIPTKTSELTNDSNYMTSSYVTSVWSGTEDEYTALGTYSDTTLYVIKAS